MPPQLLKINFYRTLPNPSPSPKKRAGFFLVFPSFSDTSFPFPLSRRLLGRNLDIELRREREFFFFLIETEILFKNSFRHITG